MKMSGEVNKNTNSNTVLVFVRLSCHHKQILHFAIDILTEMDLTPNSNSLGNEMEAKNVSQTTSITDFFVNHGFFCVIPALQVLLRDRAQYFFTVQ